MSTDEGIWHNGMRQSRAVRQEYPGRAGAKGYIALMHGTGAERNRILIVDGRRNGDARRQACRSTGFGMNRSRRRRCRQQIRQLILVNAQMS